MSNRPNGTMTVTPGVYTRNELQREVGIATREIKKLGGKPTGDWRILLTNGNYLSLRVMYKLPLAENPELIREFSTAI